MIKNKQLKISHPYMVLPHFQFENFIKQTPWLFQKIHTVGKMMNCRFCWNEHTAILIELSCHSQHEPCPIFTRSSRILLLFDIRNRRRIILSIQNTFWNHKLWPRWFKIVAERLFSKGHLNSFHCLFIAVSVPSWTERMPPKALKYMIWLSCLSLFYIAHKMPCSWIKACRFSNDINKNFKYHK